MAALLPIYNAVHEKFDEKFEGCEGKIEEIMYLVQKHVVRDWLKNEKKRVDGRGIDEIRPLNAQIDLLPAFTARVCSPAVRPKCSRLLP